MNEKVKDILLMISVVLTILAIITSIAFIVYNYPFEVKNIEKRANNKTINTFNFDNSIKADEHTGILYYVPYGDERGLCPYYSENGKLCRYVDGKIVEIDD